MYKKEKKASVIEYKEIVDSQYRVLVFRDLNESAEEQANYLRYVELGHKTVLRALPVFAVGVGIAMLLNELTYRLGVLEFDSFNAFFISPYSEPHLPVYSLVQPYLPFVLDIAVYVGGFTLASWLVVLICMGIRAAVRRSTKTAVK